MGAVGYALAAFELREQLGAEVWMARGWWWRSAPAALWSGWW